MCTNPWPCVRPEPHDQPHGCVHHGTTDDLGKTTDKHADATGDDQ